VALIAKTTRLSMSASRWRRGLVHR
jgi:hypothetical protein